MSYKVNKGDYKVLGEIIIKVVRVVVVVLYRIGNNIICKESF